MKTSIVALFIVSLCQAVVLGQKGYQRPQVQIPTNLDRQVSTPQTDPQTIADLKWFDVFQDDKLQALVREALVYNYDLREAVARVDGARANLGIVKSDQYPTIGVDGGYAFQRTSRDGATSLPVSEKQNRSFGSILLNLFTFELDLFGRKRKATKAAKADLLASEEAQRAVITGIISEVATSYYNLRELDFELEIANRTLASRQESLRIIKLRQERGVSNLLELRQAEELVYNATEVIPAVQKSIEQQENFISVLIGKNPQAIERGQTLTDQQMPPTVPEGLPSALLERRPDIRAVEQSLIAADARIEVAKKAYFPTISLTGFLGFQSAQLSNMFNPSHAIASIAPQIAQPIFTGGRIKSNIRLTEAEKEFLLVTYERTIQNAFREVSDALIAYRKVREVREQREILVTTLRDRSRLAYMRYNGGVANLLEALDADRELFDAELGLAQSRRDELLTIVQLYKSLGGGWQ